MNKSDNIKLALLKACLEKVDHQISTLQLSIDSINESKSNETKSSAGDKYETGMAMLQMEEQNIRKQLAQVLQIKHQLSSTSLNKNLQVSEPGALVYTNQGTYFISVGLGAVTLENQSIFCISPASPIGSQLIGLKQGDQFQFNSKEFLIQQIR